MRRKKIIEAAVVCILLLLLGAYMEFSDRSMDDKNRIIRGSPGSGRQEVELTLNAGEKLKNYDYQVSVPAQCIDEKTAQSYFSRAEKEIDETFFPEGEEAAHVTEQVHGSALLSSSGKRFRLFPFLPGKNRIVLSFHQYIVQERLPDSHNFSVSPLHSA